MEAIGILESNSIAKGIEAADAVLKAADTALLYAKPVCPGKYTILFARKRRSDQNHRKYRNDSPHV